MNGRRPTAFVVLLAMGLAACGSSSISPPEPASGTPPPTTTPVTAGSPSPSPYALPSEPWAVAAIAQPSAVTAIPSLAPGYQCHPCHYLAEDDLLGVATTPIGSIAVGVEQPPAVAIAFSTKDGAEWAAVPGFSPTTGSAATAVAANGRRIVIVGLDHDGALSWASDGGAWTQAPRQADLLVPYAAGGMTSVAAFGAGFVAGGYRDDPLHDRSAAAIWRSSDGLTWHLDRPASIFAGGRVLGLAARAGTIVAVGTDGDPNYGPAAVWRWTQAGGWRRGHIGPDPSGAMRAVVATTSGFVAVGLNGHDQGAMAWTSPDGLTWTADPDQPAFHYAQYPVRMQSVVAVPGGLVAGGWRSDEAKGSAVTWTSTDGGVTWHGPVWELLFSGGQITGVAAIGPTVVAVGRTGYPDWNRATAWATAAP